MTITPKWIFHGAFKWDYHHMTWNTQWSTPLGEKKITGFINLWVIEVACSFKEIGLITPLELHTGAIAYVSRCGRLIAFLGCSTNMHCIHLRTTVLESKDSRPMSMKWVWKSGTELSLTWWLIWSGNIMGMVVNFICQLD